MVFLEAERVRLSPREGGDWDQRSAQPGDLPPGFNALRFPRAVNAHARDVPLRHTAPQIAASFSPDMIPHIFDFEQHNILHNRKNYVAKKQKGAGPEAGKALSCNPLSIYRKCRNIDLLSIGYAFRPGLRTD